MSTVQTSLTMSSRALLHPCLRSVPRQGRASTRTYATDKIQAQATSSSVTPLALGGVGLGVAAALYYLSTNQKDVEKSDQKGQMSYRTDKPGIHDVSVKDLDTRKDPSQSDLPNDAPNNPANLEKMEQKQEQKPASKKSSPLQ